MSHRRLPVFDFSPALRRVATSARALLSVAGSFGAALMRSAKAAPIAVLFVTVMTADAQAKRLALVVGNSDYKNVYALNNASKDARDVAESLERLDFEVTLLTDAGEAGFWEKLEAFAKEAETAESTLFYFSGHAFQLDGVNYLVPTDAALSSREAIEQQTWRLDEIVSKLQSRNRQTLIFLDACRNNPLPEGQRSGTGDEGLAKLETGSGTYVAFATQPGNVTSDGAGDNSPFTLALLDHMETPGISISDMMIRVRNDVQGSTFGRQTPWDQSSLFEQFYFQPQVERSSELTEADYEMISALDPETRKRLLAALGNSGVNIKIEDIEEDEPTVEVAAVDPAEAPASGGIFEILPAAPDEQSSSTVPGQQGRASVRVSIPRPSGPGAERVGSTPSVGVVQPRDSNTAVVPRQASGVTRTETEVATAIGTDGNASAVPGQEAARVASETTVTTATEGARVASVLPDDPTAKPGFVRDEDALTLAALAPTRSLEPVIFPRSRVRGEELIADGETESLLQPELEGKELIKATQRELRRLGCYRMAIDGDWGRGSTTALARYYINRKTAADTLKPSNALVRILASEETVVCTRAVETVKKKSKAYAAAKTRAKTQPKKTSTKKPTSTKRIVKVTQTKKTKTGTTKKTIKRINSGVFR